MGERQLQQGSTSTKHIHEELSLYRINDDNYKESKSYLFAKRLLDLILSLVFLIPALILIVIFSILIKIESRGPALYVQERVGLKGAYFNVYKLRSMRQDAEKNGAVWAQANDPRVTRIGKIIRVTRIDELPQLFNVLKGEMSFVGPRPERPIFIEEFSQQIPEFANRLLVKPGLTGWAQVNGGYEITPEEKFHLDMYYIENKNILLDLKILLKTVRVVLTGEGAR